MRYFALATDYDGTIAHHGKVDGPTLDALRRLKESGRRLILVSGRELEDLQRTFDRLDLFDLAVLENGALLYRPRDRSEKVLGEPPPPEFVELLRKKGVQRISVGRCIVATWVPHQEAALEAIRELGLEHQVIFNKGAVMILPSGLNKAVGLEAALGELGLSRHNTVGVGDAENDHAFLAFCECAAAVSNALPILKERADLVLERDHGAGVIDLIDRLLADDLADAPAMVRHAIRLGTRDDDGSAISIEPFGLNILIAGTSGSGKSTMVTGLLERLAECKYQFAVIDPEGDYSTLEHAVVLGDPHRAPLVKEVLDLLADPSGNVVVNLLGIALEHRPAFFDELLPRLQELRSKSGRPHWIVIDETHHLLPEAWAPSRQSWPGQPSGMLFITVHPESVAPEVLRHVGLVLAVGETPDQTLRSFGEAVGEPAPEVDPSPLEAGEAIAWRRDRRLAPVKVRTEPPRTERIRHSRKYAEGDLGDGRAFYFRGPEGALRLKAQNLVLFLQIADGVDDPTWLHHLRRGDYSTWFRHGIKDDDLAGAAAPIEQQPNPDPQATRRAIRAAIEQRYTLPTGEASGEVAPEEKVAPQMDS